VFSKIFVRVSLYRSSSQNISFLVNIGLSLSSLLLLFVILDKEYAGHDITLAIGLMKTDAEWLDRFVQMEQKWKDDAQGWVEYMECKYPKCGKLDKWDEDPESWAELSDAEKEAISKCIIM
jgi:hypothetical protein